MVEYGPALRALVEGAAAAQASRTPVEALLVVKAIARGVRFVDLLQVDRRAQADVLIGEIRAEALAAFEAWAERYEAPQWEVENAVAVLEANAARHLETVAETLEPQETAAVTAQALFYATAAPNPVFEDDLVVRDITRALGRAVFAAAAARADALQALELRLAP